MDYVWSVGLTNMITFSTYLLVVVYRRPDFSKLTYFEVFTHFHATEYLSATET